MDVHIQLPDDAVIAGLGAGSCHVFIIAVKTPAKLLEKGTSAVKNTVRRRIRLRG
jgi:hypothetical protein